MGAFSNYRNKEKEEDQNRSRGITTTVTSGGSSSSGGAFGQYRAKKDEEYATTARATTFADPATKQMNPLSMIGSGNLLSTMAPITNTPTINTTNRGVSRPISAPSEPTPTLRDTVKPFSMTNPTMEETYGTTITTPRSRAENYVQDRLDREEEALSGNKLLSGVNKLLQPVSKYVYGVAASPTISGFQQGAGNVLGIKADTAPMEDTIGNKIGQGLGMIAGGVTNPTNISQGLVSTPYNIGRGISQRGAQYAAGATSAVNKSKTWNPIKIAEEAIQATTQKNLQPLLNGNKLLSNQFAQRAIEGSVAGGIQGGVISGARGETDAKELLTNIGLGAGLGALGDVGMAAIGSGARALGRAGNNAAESVLGNQLNASQAIESAANSVPVNGRYRVVNNDEILNNALKEIKTEVDVRLNARPNLNAYEVANQVASSRGIDLEGMLNNQNPTFMQAAERLRMGGVAGAIEPPKNARIAVSNKVDELVDTPSTGNKEDMFSKLFGTGGVGIRAGGGSAKELIDTHVTTRAKSQGSLWDDVQNGYDKIVQERIDQFEPFRKIGKDTYDKAMDTTRANNLANVTIKDNFVNLDGEVIGKGLKQVYDEVPANGKDISDRYLILRDAVVDMENKKKVYPDEKWFPQTVDEAQQMVTELEARYPWLQKFGDDWNEFNANRLNMWAESGIASRLLTDHLLETRPNYVPKFRQQKANSLRTMFKGGKSGMSNQKAPIQKSKGSTAKIVEPAQGMIDTTAASYQAMLRNRVMQDIYSKVSENPERFKGIIDIPDEVASVNHRTVKELNDILNEDGLEGVADFLNGEAKLLMNKSAQDTVGKDNMVTVLIEGNPVKMQIHDPSVLKAIDGISPTQLEGILGVIDVLSRGIKQSATGVLAPIQGAKLFLRDLPVALTQSKDKVRFLQDFSHAMVSQIADWLPKFVPGSENVAKLAREYYNAGGGYEAYLKGDSRIRAAARDITPAPVFSKRGLGKLAKQVNPLKPFKEFGDAMENIPRIAAFNASMRKAGWVKDESTVRKALEEAREATVNWSRKGAKGQETEALFPYSNAAIQGTYRFAKRFKEQPVSAVALIASVAAAKIASYEKFKDDPDYEQRSKFEKGIVVNKREDGKFVTVPIEATESFVADRILDLWKAVKGEETTNAKEMVQSGAEAFLPSYLSGPVNTFTSEGKGIDASKGIGSTFSGTVFEPLMAVTTGKNYFGGDIVPPEYQSNSTANQYDATSSAAGKWAAENLGIDAFTFDYLGKKFGGDIAKVALPASSDIGSADTQGNIMDEVYTRLKLLEDPIMKNNISNEYFNLKEKVTELNADYGDGKIESLPSWYEEVYKNVTSNNKGSINKQVSELTAERKSVERDTLLTSKQRADKVRDIQTQINLLRLEGIRIMEQLGVK